MFYLYCMAHGKAWDINMLSVILHFASGFLLLLENFETFLEVIFFCFAQTTFSWQFIQSSNTSRRRFLTAFCPFPFWEIHFSERPAANDSFRSNFDFALPHVFRSAKICLNSVATSDQFEAIDSPWTFCCVLTGCL